MKGKKITAALLALTILLGVAGCTKKDGGKTDPSVTQPTDTASDYIHHKVEGTLHKITVTPGTRAFVQNGSSEYKIATGADTATKTAGEFISKHVSAATGARLSVVDEDSVTYGGQCIYIGCDRAFASAGLRLPDDDIGNTGYYIKNVDDAYYIQAKDVEAYQLAAIAFLRETLGYDMLAEDCVIYENSGETLPDMEVIERPDIDYRINGNISTSGEIYGMGFAMRSMYMPVKDDSGANVDSSYHNSLSVLPPALYEATYPEWYVMAGGVKQLCYTAHGNYTSYLVMVETAANKLIATIEAEPDFDTLNFGQSDGFQVCGCEYCTKCAEQYGAVSATLLMFINDVDDKIQAYLEQKAIDEATEKREFHLTFFAYHATQEAPVIKTGYGAYTPYTADWNSRFDEAYNLPEDKRELRCNENVGVLVAPIETYHSHTFYEPINEAYYDVVKGWSTLTDYLCMWMYQSLFHDDYFYPLNTFDTMVENYRLSRECNVHIMFYQGNLHNSYNPGFTLLKRYIESKAALDVNVSTKQHIDKFFKYFYGSAGEEMQRFFDELQAHMVYLESAFGGAVTGSSYDTQVSKASHWPKKMLDGWMELIERAYAKIDAFDSADKTKRDAYALHIRAESLLPRWALLRNYDGYFSSQQLSAERKSFREDCINLGITHQTEADELDLSSWGA